jgi:hypothetical protein
VTTAVGSAAVLVSGLKSGWNQRWAIKVGTTALPITAVSRIVYWRSSMM